MTEPTVSDLRAAFESSGLERHGWTFERAMNDSHASWAIKHRARDMVRNRAKHATPGGHVAKPWNGTVPESAKRVQHTCKAVRINEQMCCGKCGTQWDMNDPEPPECGAGVEMVRGLK